MRSGKTHSALLEIEGRKGRQTRGPGREEQVQPIWHVELESETYIQTQIATGLSLSDPLLISLFPSLYLFHSPCSSTLMLSFSIPQSNICFLMPSMSFLSPSCSLLFFCFFVFPSSSSSQPQLTSAAVGYFHFISLSCSTTWAFAVRIFAARKESGASSASHRGLQ